MTNHVRNQQIRAINEVHVMRFRKLSALGNHANNFAGCPPTLNMAQYNNPRCWTQSYLNLISRMPQNQLVSWNGLANVFGTDLVDILRK